jgi:phage repressor protein C with HTH and peptisase S24 domain
LNKAQIDRIKQAREQTGLNQQEAAKLSGLIQKDISLLEAGKKKFIPTEYIQFLYKKGVDLNWLLAGVKTPDASSIMVSEPQVPYLISGDSKNQTQIPITDIKAAAGSGYINSETLRSSDFVNLPSNLVKSGHYLCIRIKGHSMSPTLQDGGFMIIRLLEKAEWRNLTSDRVYVVCDAEGHTYLKRLRNRFASGFIVLTSDNPDKSNFPNFNLSESEIVSIWYADWYLSAKMPNVHDQFYSKVERLENSVEDLSRKFDELIEPKLKKP